MRPAAAPARCASSSAARWTSAGWSGRSGSSPRQPSDRIARAYGIHIERARVLLAGALILRETQAVLGVPLVVARGGLREGLADMLLAERSAA